MDNLIAAQITPALDSSVTFAIVYPAELTGAGGPALQSAYEALAAEHAETLAAQGVLQRSHQDCAGIQDTLQREVRRLEDTVEKLRTAARARDARKKDAEKLLDVAERRVRELVEESVRKDREIEDAKKRLAEVAAELKTTKEAAANQGELLRKRDEQIQQLLLQLKRRDQEIARLSRDLQKKSAEVLNLQSQVSSLPEKIMADMKVKSQKELEVVRGVAAAKAGEMELVKEMVKSYQGQLRQRDAEVQHMKKAVRRLPPLELSQAAGSQSPKSKPTNRVKRRPRATDRRKESNGDLEELLRRSQPAIDVQRKPRVTQSMDTSLEGGKLFTGNKPEENDTKSVVAELASEREMPTASVQLVQPTSMVTSQYNSAGELELVDLSVTPQTQEVVPAAALIEVPPAEVDQPREEESSKGSNHSEAVDHELQKPQIPPAKQHSSSSSSSKKSSRSASHSSKRSSRS